MDKIKEISNKLEQQLETYTRHMKPYIPIMGRALLVSTFIEDSLRIIVQWDNQLFFLRSYRGFPVGINHIFLFLNVVTMLVCSYLAISKRYTEYAVGGLALVVVSQAIVYQLYLDPYFFVRILSIIGALLMLLAESLLVRRRDVFAGLPNITEADRTKYVILGGRVLLILLFFSMLFSGEMTFMRIIALIVGGFSCIMVLVGFKAKHSALVLVTILSIFNIVANDWWSIEFNSSQRDFVKYDFFQILSIMGGFLLLVNVGPGSFSVDEKKKEF